MVWRQPYPRAWDPNPKTPLRHAGGGVPVLVDHHNQMLVITTGQSLGLGGFGNPALTTVAPYADNRRPAASWPWAPAVEGTGTGGTGGDFEYGEVARAGQMRSLGPTDRYFAPFTSGQGGARLDQIIRGTTVYNNLLTTVTNAFNAATGAGQPCEVAGIVMINGEEDEQENTSFSTYRSLLLQYQVDVSGDIRAITGQARDVPVFVNQMATWTRWNGHHTYPTIALAQNAAAAAAPTRIFVIGSKYGIDYYVDELHGINTGYRYMGELDGVALDAVLNLGVPWQGLRPLTAIASGTTIDTTWDIPAVNTGVAPDPANALAFDTSFIVEPWTSRQADNSLYGLELHDPHPQPARLTNAQIVGNTVRLTANKAIRTGSYFRVAYTSYPNGRSGRDEARSAKSNLRDTNPAIGIESGRALQSYARTDEIAISGGVAPPASYATLLRDLDTTVLFECQDAPANGSTANWDAVVGGVSAQNFSGSAHTKGNSTGAASAAAIGTGNIDDAWDLNGSLYYVPTNVVFNKPAGADFWVRWIGYLDRSATVCLFSLYGTDTANNLAYVESRSDGVLTSLIRTQGLDLTRNDTGLVPSSLELSIVDVYWQFGSVSSESLSSVITVVNGVAGGLTAAGQWGLMENLALWIGSRSGVNLLQNPMVGLAIMVGEQARSQAAGSWGFIAEKNALDYAALTA